MLGLGEHGVQGEREGGEIRTMGLCSRCGYAPDNV